MTRFRVLALLAIVFVLFAACGDDSKDSSSDTTAAATTTTQPEAEAKAEVAAAFEKFFNGGDKDAAGKIALLENGPKLQDTYTKAFTNPSSGGTTTKVTDVTVMSGRKCTDAGVESPCALVV